ncbi:hypothetical protein HG15A2_04250 [Adhaeretor mobilis]|uniref:Uncharacterized protein n=1 Tax=Adhaeretor mobilis TaxID=1930276 RepID=A0A517MQK5_9BACT|nr:hypothetical protein HG15A2_04250 [Adhaeretor mobilis]
MEAANSWGVRSTQQVAPKISAVEPGVFFLAAFRFLERVSQLRYAYGQLFCVEQSPQQYLQGASHDLQPT